MYVVHVLDGAVELPRIAYHPNLEKGEKSI